MKKPVKKVEYNPLTGIFTCDGKVLEPQRQVNRPPVIHMPGKTRLRFSAARLAWALHHGKMPPNDHYVLFKDGDNNNLILSNLTCVPKSSARYRQKMFRNNTSGHRNICWMENLGKWRVKLNAKNKTYHIGVFENLNEAIVAAREARETHHGIFAATE